MSPTAISIKGLSTNNVGVRYQKSRSKYGWALPLLLLLLRFGTGRDVEAGASITSLGPFLTLNIVRTITGVQCLAAFGFVGPCVVHEACIAS